MCAWLLAGLGLVLTLSHVDPARAASCSGESGAHVSPLVELYTSGRCAACPLAERSLGRMSLEQTGVTSLLWRIDEAGYGQPAQRNARERRLTFRQRLALEHRPLVLLQGREKTQWEGELFRMEVARLAERRAPLQLSLRAEPDSRGLDLEARVTFVDANLARVKLYLGAYVPMGDGTRLVHTWHGPFSLSRNSPRVAARVPAVPGKRPDQSGVAAHLQEDGTAEVLQAMTLPPCPA